MNDIGVIRPPTSATQFFVGGGMESYFVEGSRICKNREQAPFRQFSYPILSLSFPVERIAWLPQLRIVPAFMSVSLPFNSLINFQW
jgi:hypothetical protein